MQSTKTIKDLKNFFLEIKKMSYWERYPAISNYDVDQYIQLIDKIYEYVMNDK